MRIALLTEIAAPFRVPLFNALAARPDVELRVLFFAAADPRRRHYRVDRAQLRFPYRVLPGRELARGGRWLVVNGGVLAELRSFRPEVVVVGGWNQPACWLALAYARARGVPLVTWVESTLSDARPGAGPLEAVKRLFVRASTAFLVPGRASADYLKALAVDEARIAVAPNAIDADRFRIDARRDGRGSCTFLYVGRLDREKGLDVLLRAFDGVPGDLVIVGSGSEEARLRAAAPPRVRFTGPLVPDDVARRYAEADVFVLPSTSEPWGMVLNEAAAAGLPLVATDAAGAAHELVEDGVNGFLVPAGDERALQDALRRLADDADFRAAASVRSRELASRFTPTAWAEAVAALAHRIARDVR